MAEAISGSFSSGDSPSISIEGTFTVAISGDFSTSGLVMLQRSHDNGATWVPVLLRQGCQHPTFYLDGPCVVSVMEPGGGMLFKLTVAAPPTSGSINFRLGR
jgi:hypothetical protein